MVEYKSLKINLSSWKKLRRAFYSRKGETFSDYIERIARRLEVMRVESSLDDEWKDEMSNIREE